jgi:ABC-type multidrug transport system fused ATPase/permease subunit
MAGLYEAFAYTPEDFEALQKSEVSPGQRSRIAKNERFMAGLGVVLSVIFMAITILFILSLLGVVDNAVREDPSVTILIGILTPVGALLSSVMIRITLRARANGRRLLAEKIEVKTIDVPGADIKYGVRGRAYAPYQEVGELRFTQVARYVDKLFQPDKTYRIYYEARAKIVLGVALVE